MRSSDTSRNWRYIRSRAWKRKQLAALNLEIDRQVNDQLSRAGVVACGNRESDKSGSSKMPPGWQFGLPGRGKTQSLLPEYTGTKPHRADKQGRLIWKHRKKLDKGLRKHGVKVKKIEVTLRVREEDDEG